MGQNELNCFCVSVLFFYLFILLMFDRPHFLYIKPVEHGGIGVLHARVFKSRPIGGPREEGVEGQ